MNRLEFETLVSDRRVDHGPGATVESIRQLDGPDVDSLAGNGFAAENGIISQCYDGILTSPPKLENTPFEIILETPQHAPEGKQVDAFVHASVAMLAEYRKFISFAADL